MCIFPAPKWNFMIIPGPWRFFPWPYPDLCNPYVRIQFWASYFTRAIHEITDNHFVLICGAMLANVPTESLLRLFKTTQVTWYKLKEFSHWTTYDKSLARSASSQMSTSLELIPDSVALIDPKGYLCSLPPAPHPPPPLNRMPVHRRVISSIKFSSPVFI